MYREDVLLLGHQSVWGYSFCTETQSWGYTCCRGLKRKERRPLSPEEPGWHAVEVHP